MKNKDNENDVYNKDNVENVINEVNENYEKTIHTAVKDIQKQLKSQNETIEEQSKLISSLNSAYHNRQVDSANGNDTNPITHQFFEFLAKGANSSNYEDMQDGQFMQFSLRADSPSGAMLAPPEIKDELLKRIIDNDEGPSILGLVNLEITKSRQSTFTINTLPPVANYVSGETCPPADSEMLYEQETITLARMSVSVKYSAELEMFAQVPALIDSVKNSLSPAIGRAINYQIINGGGEFYGIQTSMVGILKDERVVGSGSQQVITTQEEEAISPKDLDAMEAQYRKRFGTLAGAIYVMSPTAWQLIKGHADNNNAPVYNKTLQGRQVETINGIRVVVTSDTYVADPETYSRNENSIKGRIMPLMPEATPGNFCVILGNFDRGYTVGMTENPGLLTHQADFARRLLKTLVMHQWVGGKVIFPEAFVVLKMKGEPAVLDMKEVKETKDNK